MSKIEKRKSIMLHVRSEKLLKSYIENKDEGISQEVKHLIQELPKRGMECFLKQRYFQALLRFKDSSGTFSLRCSRAYCS